MKQVAPHAGAWIETLHGRIRVTTDEGSHPTRVRGLKRGLSKRDEQQRRVAPHAGAWIETRWVALASIARSSRTPRGCVD